MSLSVCLTFQSQRSRCCAVFLQSNSVADTRVASAECFSKGGWGVTATTKPRADCFSSSHCYFGLSGPAFPVFFFFECGQGSSERLLRLAVKSSRKEGEMVPSTTC